MFINIIIDNIMCDHERIRSQLKFSRNIFKWRRPASLSQFLWVGTEKSLIIYFHFHFFIFYFNSSFCAGSDSQERAVSYKSHKSRMCIYLVVGLKHSMEQRSWNSSMWNSLRAKAARFNKFNKWNIFIISSSGFDQQLSVFVELDWTETSQQERQTYNRKDES